MGRGGWGAYARKHRAKVGDIIRYQGKSWRIEYENKFRESCVAQLKNPTHMRVKNDRDYRIIKRIRHRYDKPHPFYRIISRVQMDGDT